MLFLNFIERPCVPHYCFFTRITNVAMFQHPLLKFSPIKPQSVMLGHRFGDRRWNTMGLVDIGNPLRIKFRLTAGYRLLNNFFDTGNPSIDNGVETFFFLFNDRNNATD